MLTGDPLYQQVVAEIVVYLRREMLLDCGGFCSALDAETNAIEGEYYVWTQEEIAEILPQNQLQPFLTAYGFDQPQEFEHGRILYLPQRIPAADSQKADSELLTQLAGSRQLLLQRANSGSGRFVTIRF